MSFSYILFIQIEPEWICNLVCLHHNCFCKSCDSLSLRSWTKVTLVLLKASCCVTKINDSSYVIILHPQFSS